MGVNVQEESPLVFENRTWFIFLTADLIYEVKKGDTSDAASQPVIHEERGRKFVSAYARERFPPLVEGECRWVGYVVSGMTGTRPWELFERALPQIQQDVAKTAMLDPRMTSVLWGHLYYEIGLETEWRLRPRDSDPLVYLQKLVVERKLPVTFVSDLPPIPPPTT